MTRFFSKTSVIALMIVGGTVLTEIAFLNWPFADRVVAKIFVWSLVMILANHILQGKLNSFRFQRQ